MAKKSWDDIPSLEGLEVDWGFKPLNKQGKRLHARLAQKDLAGFLDSERIPVKVATSKSVQDGTLFDLCEGGVAVELKQGLAEEEAVRVGFFIGSEKIIAQALVKHVRRSAENYRVGMKFVGLDRTAREYILSLYAARVLKHAL